MVRKFETDIFLENYEFLQKKCEFLSIKKSFYTQKNNFT